MLIEQIDDFDLESLERFFGDLFDMLRSAIHAIRAYFEPELGGDHNLVTQQGQRFTNQLFICKWTVDFSGIEKGHTAFDRRAQQGDHLLFIWNWLVRSAHAHAAKAKGRNFQSAVSKLTFLHYFTPIFSC